MRAMLQKMKDTDGRKTRKKSSRRPDSSAAGKNNMDQTPLSSTGNTKGSILETTGYLYSKPFYGCIQSITVMTENNKFEVGETAVDFLEDVIGGSGVVGPQACSVITTRTTITDT